MEPSSPSANSGSESSAHTGLSRDLGLFDITMIGVGAMIGAGIFVLTGEAASVAGPALVLSFALNGIVTIFTAMVYAELGSAIPEAGGGYLWVKEGLPGANAFLAGWMSWFAHAVAGALYALAFGAFFYEILNLLGAPFEAVGLGLTIGQKIFGVLIGIAFAYINFRGASETGLAGNIVTVVKLIVILVFCFFGIKLMFFPDWWIDFGAVQGEMGVSKLVPLFPEGTGLGGVLTAMGITFIAFEGYEIIVQAGEEVKNPRENIPKAIFWSLAIVVPIYILVAFVLIGGTTPELLLDALRAIGEAVPEGLTAAAPNWEILGYLGELGLARAASQFLPYGAMLLAVGGILSTMSALNATTFSSTRVSFAMGRDKNLPDAFGAIHPERRTPHLALFWTALLILGMVAFVPLTTVAAAADIMFLLLFLQVNVAVITLRKKYGDKLAYGYLMPFYPIVPIVGIVTKLGLALFMFDHYPTAWLYVLAWLAVGFGIFYFYASGREREKTEPPVVAEEKAVEPSPHSVLIPVADPEAAKQYIRLGARIAERRESELVLLHAEPIPHQLPYRAASRFMGDAREILDEARRYAEQYDVPVSTMTRLARDVSDAVIYTAQDKNTDYLIMGWRGNVQGEKTRIGRNIDHVLKESNSHAIVMQRGAFKENERLLVPIANPKTAPLALAVASLLRGDDGPKIAVLHLSRAPMSEAEKETFRTALFAFADEEEAEPQALFTDVSQFDLIFDTASNPARTLVERSENYDRMILGTSHGGYFGRKVFGNLPLQVARNAQCPIVFVRPKASGVRFGVQRFFQFFHDLEEEGRDGEEGETPHDRHASPER